MTSFGQPKRRHVVSPNEPYLGTPNRRHLVTPRCHFVSPNGVCLGTCEWRFVSSNDVISSVQMTPFRAMSRVTLDILPWPMSETPWSVQVFFFGWISKYSEYIYLDLATSIHDKYLPNIWTWRAIFNSSLGRYLRKNLMTSVQRPYIRMTSFERP